jgi:uncharacterized membrane protein (UPF0182 family)
MSDQMGDAGAPRPHVTIPFDPAKMRAERSGSRGGGSTPRQRRTAIGCGALVVVAFVVWPLIRWGARVWIDWLWFGELGQHQLWWTNVLSPIAVGLVFGVLSFIIIVVNMRIARRMAPKAGPVLRTGEVTQPWEEALLVARERISPWIDRAIWLVALVAAWINGSTMAAQWKTYRIALTGVQFPIADPQFGRNVGFFVFQYPALRATANWLMGVLILTAILTLVVHLIDGAIQPWAKLQGFAPHVKAHLSVLLALIVLLQGFNYWLDIYGLDFSPRGQVTGASYTDVHAQLPAYRILIVISIVSAVILLLNIRYQGWRLPLIAVGVWVGAAVLIGGVWPALMQQFIVKPNEVEKEAPYIARNIRMTRIGFGLADVKGRAFPALEDLTAKDIIADRTTLQNVRLWNPAVADKVYAQLQALRQYYEFPDVDVDRYQVEPKASLAASATATSTASVPVTRQVLVAAREVNASKLPEAAQTWLNRHLVYTHGFGLVMSPVNEADSRGLPRMLIGDVPPRTDTNLVTKEGRIYFGERTDNYIIVDTGTREFDYPLGERNATYEYKGSAGVPVGSIFRRLAWAITMSEGGQILFSQSVRPESRMVFRRNIRERVQTLAPFLTLDSDPYPVLVEGRIKWVIDAYTTSAYFPYSEPLTGSDLTYLRNSVKVVIDAFDGATALYAFDPQDPILQAWSKVYPELFTPGTKIPSAIREHFRYPSDQFTAQAEIYRNYHMTDPRVFYNKEDSWAIPNQSTGNPMEPFFVLMRLPGEAQEHFYLMQPYTPRNRANMIGWVAANSDPEKYGERIVYLFPKERVVLGPEQVLARINQDPLISPQLSLWNQRGSQAIFGNMLVIPIKNSIVYIVPLYLQAETTAIPQLTKVVVSYSDKVEMENTLEGALLKIFGAEQPAGGTGSIVTTGTAGGGATGGAAATARRAAQLYQQAVAAQRAGDWATYGARIKELGNVLSQLAGQETTATK